MASVLPDSHRDLMEKPIIVSIVTIDEHGQPHAVPIWRKVDDQGRILMSSDSSSRKVRSIRANPQVAVLTIDPANPYRYLEIGGTAELVETGARELLDELARFYSDKPAYFGHWEPIEAADTYDGVVIRITPTRFVKG